MNGAIPIETRAEIAGRAAAQGDWMTDKEVRAIARDAGNGKAAKRRQIDVIIRLIDPDAIHVFVRRIAGLNSFGEILVVL